MSSGPNEFAKIRLTIGMDAVTEVGVSRDVLCVEHSRLISPEDFYNFIELPSYTNVYGQLGWDPIDNRLIRTQIMLGPSGAPIDPNFSPARCMQYLRHEEGDSFQAQILYAVFENIQVCVLMAIFAPDVSLSLSRNERKEVLSVIREIEKMAQSKGLNI